MALGCTVKELETRISCSELFLWLAWRRLNGPICVQKRNDWHAAIVAQSFNGGNLNDYLLKFETDSFDPDDFDAVRDKAKQIAFKFGVNLDELTPKKITVEEKKTVPAALDPRWKEIKKRWQL